MSRQSPEQRAWLRTHLINTGHMTSTGITRRARVHMCKCGERVLRGRDDEVCAFIATVDLVTLTQLGEFAAIAQGKRTWTFTREGGKWVLDVRVGDDITWAPATSDRYQDVMPEHRCGQPIPEQLTTSSTFTPPAEHFLPPGSPAPF